MENIIKLFILLLAFTVISTIQTHGFNLQANELDDYLPHGQSPADGQDIEDDEHEESIVSNNPIPRRRTNSRKMNFPKIDNRPFLTHLQSEMSRPRGKCDRRVRIPNGVTRVRDRGTLVRFQCSHEFFLVGASMAVCVRGQWSDPPPLCVRGGCRQLPIPQHGSLRQLYGNGVAMFSCGIGYVLEGSPILICDGLRWNGTAPSCEPMAPLNLSPPTTTFPTIPLEIITPEPEAENKTASVFIPESEVTVNPSATSPSTTENQGHTNTSQIQLVLQTTEPTKIFEASSILPTTQESSTEISNKASTIPTQVISITTEGQFQSSTNEIDQLGITTERISSSASDGYLIVSTASSTIISNPVSVSTSTISTLTETTPGTEDLTSTAETVRRTTTQQTSSSPTPEETSTMIPSVDILELVLTTTTKLPSTTPPRLISSKQTTTTSEPSIEDNAGVGDGYTLLGKSPTFSTVHEVIAISPEKRLVNATPNSRTATNTRSSTNYFLMGLALIGVIVIIILSIVFRYLWRKHKGIARANCTDLDGKTLQFHEGSDEIIWSDSNSYCSRL